MKLYYSESKGTWAGWFDGMHLLAIADSPNEHEKEIVKTYSDNAIKAYLSENGYKRVEEVKKNVT